MAHLRLTGHAPILVKPHRLPRGADEVTMDLSDVTFVTPLDLVALASMLQSAIAQGRRVRVIPPVDGTVLAYLRDMGFLERFHPDEPGNAQDSEQFAGPRLPLMRVEQPDEFDDRWPELEPRIRSELSQEVCLPLFQILSELIDNAATHGRSEAGAFLAAQYYTGATSAMPEGLWVAVSDSGIGLPAHLRKNPLYARITDDWRAIGRAVRANVSGTLEPARGWGLYEVGEQSIELGRGIMLIRSGRGEGRFWINRNARTARYDKFPTRTDGTLVLVRALRPRGVP